MDNATQHGRQESAFEPFDGGLRCAHHTLDPTIFPDADGIETLSTPRLSFAQKRHNVQVDELL